ncbi:MAG: TfoX/Sxy family protein [Cyclobacteriaceae bacterium]|nr:TfoX/Sxy family protein [Cyclobacteriaceae bacterium]
MPIIESQITILDQLSLLESVTPKRMFGGVGFFQEGKMFGMLNSKSTFLLKVDDSNREDYLELGMAPFSHNMNKKGSMPYYEVPLDVVESKKEVTGWARKSINIALNT